MKKLIVIAALGIAFAACKKAQDILPSNSITGKWYAVKDIYSVTDKNGVTKVVDTATYNHTDNIIFNTNGTGTDTQGSSYSAFVYSVNGSNLTLTYTGSTAWNIPIKQLSSASLELYYVITDKTDGHSENHDITYSK